MARLGRRSEFADSDEEEVGFGGGDLVNLDEGEDLWNYSIGQRSGSRAESDFPLKKYSNSMFIPIINHKMDEHTGKILRVVESLNIRLSKMDLRSRQLETSVDEVKHSFEWQHERNHEKLRQLEDIMQEIQGAVKDLKDKYEIAEAHIELAKLQISKDSPPQQKKGTALSKEAKPTFTGFSNHLNQQFTSPGVASPALPSVDHIYPSNPPRQNLQPPASNRTPVQLPPVIGCPPPPATPYQHPEQSYGGHTVLQAQDYQPAFTMPSMPYKSTLDSTQSAQRNFYPYPVVSQHASYMSSGECIPAQPQNYYYEPVSQFHGTSQRTHGFAVAGHHFDPRNEYSSDKGHNAAAYKSYLYGVPSKNKVAHSDSPPAERRHNSMQGPVPEVSGLSLPHALPMASFIDEEPNTSDSEKRASTDEADIIDKVAAMGFRRDIVKVTIKKLKEDGDPVDLNTVLDKLMTSA